jgi:hypothetical protein
VETFQIVCASRRKCDHACIKQVGTVDRDPKDPVTETDLFPTKIWKIKNLRPFLENRAFGCFMYEGDEIAWVEPYYCACGKSSVRVVGSSIQPDSLDDLPLCFAE